MGRTPPASPRGNLRPYVVVQLTHLPGDPLIRQELTNHHTFLAAVRRAQTNCYLFEDVFGAGLGFWSWLVIDARTCAALYEIS